MLQKAEVGFIIQQIHFCHNSENMATLGGINDGEAVITGPLEGQGPHQLNKVSIVSVAPYLVLYEIPNLNNETSQS